MKKNTGKYGSNDIFLLYFSIVKVIILGFLAHYTNPLFFLYFNIRALTFHFIIFNTILLKYKFVMQVLDQNNQIIKKQILYRLMTPFTLYQN